MGEPLVIPFGGGEVIGDSPERRVEILSDDETLNATWSRFGPGREGADLHVHLHHSDLFYVLDGELTVRLGIEDRNVVVPSGMVARVPPGVVHGFRNAGGADLVYLNFHAPGQRFADYLRAVRDGRDFSYDQHPPPADGGRPPADASIGPPPVSLDEIAIAETNAEGLSEHHRAHDRLAAFYVLAGALTFTVDGRELAADAGSWVQVPAGAAHALVSSGPARFLEIRTPG